MMREGRCHARGRIGDVRLLLVNRVTCEGCSEAVGAAQRVSVWRGEREHESAAGWCALNFAGPGWRAAWLLALGIR